MFALLGLSAIGLAILGAVWCVYSVIKLDLSIGDLNLDEDKSDQ